MTQKATGLSADVARKDICRSNCATASSSLAPVHRNLRKNQGTRSVDRRRCTQFRALAALVLVLIFVGYGARWTVCHAGLLFDPGLQNDDARTALFPFHQYADNPSLAHDPIAREMMAYVSPGIWALYRILVPLTGLYAASKWVQALALGVLALAGTLLARSRRGGFASGLLLVYLILSDPYAVGRIAGGHARAFAFPLFALWVAGIVGSQRVARFAAPVLGALFYPAVTLMILAGEGAYAAWAVVSQSWQRARRRLWQFACVAGIAVLCAWPTAMGGDRQRGPIHTLAQARAEPAFYRDGRLWVLPFGEPTEELGRAFLARFSSSGKTLLAASRPSTPVFLAASTAAAFTLLTILLQRRRAQALPSYFWSFLLGTTLLYFAARWLAFRLYSTERYYAYGMRMASTLLVVALCARFRPRWRSSRFTARTCFAASFMLVGWLMLGDGMVGNNGMTIDARWDADVYRFMRTLPKGCRFASHPMDGDGIPYYAARATLGSFETLQPWFVDSWRRQLRREKATLDALYATELQPVVDFARRFQVDYLLINMDRYQSDWRSHMDSFEPFTTHTRLRARNHTAPALATLPRQAIVFERPPWRIVGIERLATAVAQSGPASASHR